MALSWIVVLVGTAFASATAPAPTDADVAAADAAQPKVEQVQQQ